MVKLNNLQENSLTNILISESISTPLALACDLTDHGICKLALISVIF